MMLRYLPEEVDSKAFSISLISHCLPEKQASLSVEGTSKNSGRSVSCGDGWAGSTNIFY